MRVFQSALPARVVWKSRTLPSWATPSPLNPARNTGQERTSADDRQGHWVPVESPLICVCGGRDERTRGEVQLHTRQALILQETSGGGGGGLPDLYVCLPAFLNMPSFLVSPVLARMTISECHLMASSFFFLRQVHATGRHTHEEDGALSMCSSCRCRRRHWGSSDVFFAGRRHVVSGCGIL